MKSGDGKTREVEGWQVASGTAPGTVSGRQASWSAFPAGKYAPLIHRGPAGSAPQEPGSSGFYSAYSSDVG